MIGWLRLKLENTHLKRKIEYLQQDADAWRDIAIWNIEMAETWRGRYKTLQSTTNTEEED